MANDMATRPPFSKLITTETAQKTILNTLRDPQKAQRFTTAIISAVSVNPALQECEYSTIVSAALLGETLNLSPSPQLGHYYLVPYDNKKKGYKEATFQLGWHGMVQLALRSGYYKHINVLPLKQGELKKWNPLTEEIDVAIIEDDEQREALPTVGYVATFEYLNGFTKTIYWSREKVISHADRYSPAFSKNATKGKYPKVSFEDYCAGNYPKEDEWKYSSFWYKDFDGMACKTLLRQLISKWGIMSIEMQTAFEADVETEEYTVTDDGPAPTEIGNLTSENNSGGPVSLSDLN